MCGRFTLRTPAAAWTQEWLPLWSDQEVAHRAGEMSITARFNIAPTQEISIVIPPEDQSPRRHWGSYRWGLVPAWATDANIGNRMINARAETVHEKRSFKSAFQKRRCLIPADGYYEWQATNGAKQPYLIERPNSTVFAMAGLWESNRKLGRSAEEPLNSCTIITTNANETTSRVHDRMPVMLEQSSWDTWLDPNTRPDDLRSLLKPAPEDWFRLTAVSRFVGNPRNEGPECVRAIE
ncbi:MAG: SOS response-associated peptidase, partial [Planctomycetota bacterium]